MRSRRGFENLIGTSDMVSTPPAITTSAWPVWIRLMPEHIAWFDEMQAWVTVCEGTSRGMPAARPASRAMFWFLTSWMTVPMIT